MRRRIYVDPEGDLGDHTLDAYLFEEEFDFPPPGQPFTVCDTGALYDNELWSRYQIACHEAAVLRARIVEKLVAEPYDEVELWARDEYKRVHAPEDWDEDAIQRVRQRLMDNAAKKDAP